MNQKHQKTCLKNAGLRYEHFSPLLMNGLNQENLKNLPANQNSQSGQLWDGLAVLLGQILHSWILKLLMFLVCSRNYFQPIGLTDLCLIISDEFLQWR